MSAEHDAAVIAMRARLFSADFDTSFKKVFVQQEFVRDYLCEAVYPCPGTSTPTEPTDGSMARVSDNVVTNGPPEDVAIAIQTQWFNFHPESTPYVETAKVAILDGTNFAIDIIKGGFKDPLRRVIVQAGELLSENEVEELSPVNITSHYSIY